MQNIRTFIFILISLSASNLFGSSFTRASVGLLETEHVHELPTAREGVACHIILPYQQDLGQTFGNKSIAACLDQHGYQYDARLKRLDKKYSVAVVAISNRSKKPIYVVKDSYLHNEYSDCCCAITPREKFLQHYPNLDELLNDFSYESWWYMGPGVIFTTVGAILSGVACVSKYRTDKEEQTWQNKGLAAGIFSMLTGVVFITGGASHQSESHAPIKALKKHHAGLKNYLQPKIVPGVVDLAHELPKFIKLLMQPTKYRAHKNVYEIHPEETLIEVVIMKKSDLSQVPHLTLQHYDKNPRLIHDIHPSIHSHAHIH